MLAYQFSKAATAMLEGENAIIPLHPESGRFLPFMIDKNSGRIIELAKGTSGSALQLGRCFAMITSLCHFISSRDIAKQLTEVARNLSLLSAARCTDQDAKIDRIYTQAREILGRKKIDCPEVLKLRNKRHDLYELRQRWRGDISVLLRSTAIQIDAYCDLDLGSTAALKTKPSTTWLQSSSSWSSSKSLIHGYLTGCRLRNY